MRSVVPRIARIIAAAALVLAATGHSWLVNGGRELHGGLLSFDSGGERWTNADLVAAAGENGAQHVSRIYAPAGQLTFGLALLAAALLVVTAIVAVRRIRRIAVYALGVTLVACIAFMASKPSGPAFGLQPGWSAIVFFLATGLGTVLSDGLPRRRPAA